MLVHIVPPMINRNLGFTNDISVDLYEINVGEDPFVEVPFNITNVILYCMVSGREMPTVNWTTPISLDNDTFTIQSIVQMNGLLYVVVSMFSISNFTNDYAGLYLCNASNCAGQDVGGVNATQQGNCLVQCHSSTLWKVYNKCQVLGVFCIYSYSWFYTYVAILCVCT